MVMLSFLWSVSKTPECLAMPDCDLNCGANVKFVVLAIDLWDVCGMKMEREFRGQLSALQLDTDLLRNTTVHTRAKME
jgi:hypothetical protein